MTLSTPAFPGAGAARHVTPARGAHARRQVFLDTETTGLDAAQGDRLVEIGLIEMVDRRLTGRTLHRYLNPQRPVHPEAFKVHGLSDEFLAGQPLFADVVDEIVAFCDGAEVLIHNAEFDLGFIDAELARLERNPLRHCVHGVVDTLRLARDTYPGKANSLDALCRRLEVDNTGRTLHGALLDAGLLAEVYIRITRGQESLVIGDDDGGGAAQALQTVDFSRFALPALVVAQVEREAHDALCAELDKASGGKTLWRRVDGVAVASMP